jgi:hypothetical protein
MLKKLTQAQKSCMNDFEDEFEFSCCMHREDFNKGKLTFEEFFQKNIEWVTSNFDERVGGVIRRSKLKLEVEAKLLQDKINKRKNVEAKYQQGGNK